MYNVLVGRSYYIESRCVVRGAWKVGGCTGFNTRTAPRPTAHGRRWIFGLRVLLWCGGQILVRLLCMPYVAFWHLWSMHRHRRHLLEKNDKKKEQQEQPAEQTETRRLMSAALACFPPVIVVEAEKRRIVTLEPILSIF